MDLTVKAGFNGRVRFAARVPILPETGDVLFLALKLIARSAASALWTLLKSERTAQSADLCLPP